MKELEKYVSQFTQELFPEFYKEEGELYIAFVKAYYEWMESTNRELYHSRRIPEYRDVDRTVEDFIIYFKTKYLPNVQFNTASNKELFIKNSLDFYRAKGTERAVDLFFKLIYGFEARVYYPGDDLFKLSDNEFINVQYLEIQQVDSNINFVGQVVTGSLSESTAFVERLIRIKKDARFISVLMISGSSGDFITGEQIFTTDLENNVSVRMIGSLSTLQVSQSSSDFTLGETLNIIDGNGKRAKARVSEVSNFQGLVQFELLEGGWGYSAEADVIGSQFAFNLLDVSVTNQSFFAINDYFKQFETVRQDTLLLEVNEFSNNSLFSLSIDGTQRMVSYENGDPNTGNVIFESTIVKTVATPGEETITVAFDGNVYDNTVFNESLVEFSYVDNVVDYTANVSAATYTVATANLLAMDDTLIVEYTYDADPTETNLNQVQVGHVLEQFTLLNGVTKQVANAVVTEVSFDNSTNKATATLQRDIGQFRNSEGFIERESSKEYTIQSMGGTRCGINTAVNSFFRFATITGLTTGTTAKIDKVTGFTTEASFTIDDLSNSTTIRNFWSDLPQPIRDYDTEVGPIANTDYGMPGVGGYNDIIADVISANGTFLNIPLYRIGDIVVTNPGVGYGDDPFFIISDDKTKHLERYDFELQYFNGDGDTNIERNFVIGEVIEGVTSGCKAILLAHDQESRLLKLRRITISSDTYNIVEALSPSSDFIGPESLLNHNRLSSTDPEGNVQTNQALTGELITSDNLSSLTNVTTRIQAVRETRRRPRSGLNAQVLSESFNGNNFITAVDVIDSGFGYNDEEILRGVSVDDKNRTASFKGFLERQGVGEGYYLNRKSFLSSDKYIQDNDFYQEYSYQVLTALPFSTYKDTLIKVLHVAGTKPFGGYVATTEAPVELDLSITYSNYELRRYNLFVNDQTFFEHDLFNEDEALTIDVDFT